MFVGYGESILIKMTPEDINAIKAKMEQAGIKNRSAYIRKMARDGYVIMLDLSDIKEVIRLLRINSDTLSLCAEKINDSGAVSLEDIKELQSQQEEIWEAVRGILERLGNIAKVLRPWERFITFLVAAFLILFDGIMLENLYYNFINEGILKLVR